jgi:hypothetical protein
MASYMRYAREPVYSITKNFRLRNAVREQKRVRDDGVKRHR